MKTKSIGTTIRWLLGIEQGDKKAHKIKNQMTREILEISRQVDKTNRYIKKTTAYKIAHATGGKKRGL